MENPEVTFTQIDVGILDESSEIPMIDTEGYLRVVAGYFAAKASASLGNTADIARQEVDVRFCSEFYTYYLAYIGADLGSDIGLLVRSTSAPNFEAIAVGHSESVWPPSINVFGATAETQGVYEGDESPRLFTAVLRAILENEDAALEYQR